MDAKQLAQLVIDVLNLQRRYFKTRELSDLTASKDAERKLRKAAEEILQPPPAKTPGLFEG